MCNSYENGDNVGLLWCDSRTLRSFPIFWFQQDAGVKSQLLEQVCEYVHMIMCIFLYSRGEISDENRTRKVS